MSAIHRVDDIRSMPARRFLGLAKRLIYYPNSALRQLIEIEQEKGGDNRRPVTAHVYTDVKHNLEAFQLGIIEGGTG
jgi:hypothetical protein